MCPLCSHAFQHRNRKHAHTCEQPVDDAPSLWKLEEKWKINLAWKELKASVKEEKPQDSLGLSRYRTTLQNWGKRQRRRENQGSASPRSLIQLANFQPHLLRRPLLHVLRRPAAQVQRELLSREAHSGSRRRAVVALA